MDEKAMLTRDLVLRLCANATELDEGWLRTERKVVAPFTSSRDTVLIEAIVAASRALGVNRVLVCRTRAEYAYEPVTEVRAETEPLGELVRGWGPEPTDFLVAVEDMSAAVLVTSNTLTVAAGPAVFVRRLVGADIAQARADFAEEARESHDSELLRAAHRYGCLEIGGRHARGTRGPGPDLAERLANHAAAIRERAPKRVARLRALRGAWGWSVVLVLVLAGIFVPGLSATVPVTLGMVWLVTQLAWLSRSRTVSFAALMRMLALGALIAGPIAAVELAVAGAVGLAPEDPFAYAYIAVPVEELGKLAPLLLLWLVARRRFKRFAAVDYLLLACASGAGFHLVEQAIRAVVLFGQPDPVAPSLGVFTLLPGGVEPGLAEELRFSGHGVTTALVGGALGLAAVGRRHYGAWLWLLPPLALGLAALEHLTYNAYLVGLEPTPITAVTFAAAGNGFATRWLVLLLLVIAVLMDHRLAGMAADVTPRLPGRPPLSGLLRRAHGWAIRRRVRVPGDVAPVFRRMGAAWARFPVTLAETLVAVLHEATVMLVAAGRGPETLCESWRFLRARREFAMGAGRAAGRPWRQTPARPALIDQEERLATALGVGPSLAAAGALVSLVVMVSTPGAVTATVEAGYAAMSLRGGGEWLATLPVGARIWAGASLVALFGLLLSGWAVPRGHPSLREFLRDPSRNIAMLLGVLAPGQLPYAAVSLAGLAVPSRAERLLGRPAVNGREG